MTTVAQNLNPTLHNCRLPAAAAFAFALLCAASAIADTDRVRLLKGSDNGEITEMSPIEVTLKNGHKIPVNQIKAILFDSEPNELNQARVSIANGAYAKATQLLDKITAAQTERDFIKQDVEFYQAANAARLALGGEGEIVEAGRKLNSFVRSYPNNYHYLEACELMGDLLMASGRFEPAQKQFAELAKAPWPDYKIRAAVATGRSLQAQNKHAEAITQFDAALAIPDEGSDTSSQKLAATLGKAISLADSGKVDEAAGMIEKIIQDADPQQRELHAQAYNALGTCYEKANRPKQAFFAYMHVDVLYSTLPERHAEALYHLVPLAHAIGEEDQSKKAREQLQQKYPNSRWTKQLKD